MQSLVSSIFMLVCKLCFVCFFFVFFAKIMLMLHCFSNKSALNCMTMQQYRLQPNNRHQPVGQPMVACEIIKKIRIVLDNRDFYLDFYRSDLKDFYSNKCRFRHYLSLSEVSTMIGFFLRQTCRYYIGL